MADVHGSPGAPGLQMPQNGNAGSAPVPYQGADQSPEPPDYAAQMGPMADAAATVMAGVTGLNTTESPVAHDIGAATPDAPYYPGATDPIFTGGADDAGGRSPVAGAVDAAVSAATGRWQELQSDTYAQGSTMGDLITFPPSPLDPGVGVGNTAPVGGFYDPDRDYGGTQGAPGYQGEAQ
jgi:hypothetical protein